MSEEFWWGVIVTLLVGLPGAYVMSVFAHMHAPRFNERLARRRLLKRTKTKEQAVRAFNRIKDLRTGKKEKYAYYILLGTGAAILTTIAATLMLIFSVHSGYKYPISIEYGIVVLVAIIFFLFSVLCLSSIYETARQLERFDDYKAEVEAQWGSLDHNQHG